MKRDSIIVSSKEILGGTPVFAGTRVPAKTLTDYLKTDHTLEQFLDDFPSVTRQQAIEALDLMRDQLALSLA